MYSFFQNPVGTELDTLRYGTVIENRVTISRLKIEMTRRDYIALEVAHVEMKRLKNLHRIKRNGKQLCFIV